jgi:hypothetical protein
MSRNFDAFPVEWREVLTNFYEGTLKKLVSAYGPEHYSREITAAHEAGHVIAF